MDTVYRQDAGDRVYTEASPLPFLHFVCEVGGHFDGLTLFGRRDPGGVAERPLPSPARVAYLPYYENLAKGMQVLKATPGTVAGMWRGLDEVDAVWVFGPYPFSPVLVAFALMRRRRVVLGVRQDTMRYFRSRLPRKLAAPVLAPLWLVDRFYRLASRVVPTVVVGAHLERQYGGPRPKLTALRISLVREKDVVEAPPSHDWDGTIELLTVGRVDAEKNPLLLVDAMTALEERHPGRFRLTWVGDGPMMESVRARASDLRQRGVVDFRGYVPFGPDLLRLYRESHAFLHVANTDAFPQVLTEAMGSGTPIVATAVGGVPEALEGGALGLMVPPADMDALVQAVETLAEEPGERDGRVERGLTLARRHTLEAEAARVAALFS